MPNIQIGGANLLNNPTSQSVNGVSNQNGQVKIIGNYSYNLRHCLGEGAYGKVYEGVEKNTQKTVAIKKLDIRQFQNDTYLRNSIISEIEILKRFNHKNIVKFIDLITTQRSLYIITEFCKDKDLRFLIQNKRLTESQALHILRDIVEGFQELVKHNVIHRDLKPANILINDQVFKIADFGFAKYVDYSSAQLLRSCVGSPLYMAPQILARKAYGLKSDIWSIGVIFHEMVYQDVPWKARDERELLNNIMRQPFKVRKNVKLQSISEEILRRTLVIEEKDRISWDDLFKIFDQYDAQNRNLPNPFGPSISNKENAFPLKLGSAANIMQPATSNNISQPNKLLKKSIFDNNNQATQKVVIPATQNPINNANIKRQTSLPTNNQVNGQIGIANNRQYEVKKIFMMINNNRQQVAFKHFVCVDLFSKIKKNTQLMNNQQLDYQKLILCMAASVKLDMQQLLLELNENENANKDLFNNTKELKALSQTIKKEQEFYKAFVDEFLQYIRNANYIEQLKNDKEVSFIFQKDASLNEFTDQDKQRVDDFISSLGNKVSKDILNNVRNLIGNKQSLQELEQYRPYIVSAEYVLDVIENKKKYQKGQEVFFDQLHLQKSEHSCVKVHLDKVNNKISIFGFNLLP
ncbi:hypothetical protein ABPG72_001308 [Tetrahymena utriculariae]